MKIHTLYLGEEVAEEREKREEGPEKGVAAEAELEVPAEDEPEAAPAEERGSIHILPVCVPEEEEM